VNGGHEHGGGAALFDSLVSQLVEALPEVDVAGAGDTQRDALLHAAGAHPLVLLVDDLHELDEGSLLRLAALAHGAPPRRLLLVASAQLGAKQRAAEAFSVLRRHCASLALSALSREDTESLLGSIFGDVPNLALLGDCVFGAAAGNPGATLEILHALLARGVLRYEGGTWLLPGQLDAGDLPSSAAESCKQRVLGLSPLARRLAEVHALASHPSLSRSDYAAAATFVPAAAVDAAITELVSQHVLAGDGRAYVLSSRDWATALTEGLDGSSRAARHETLAELYAGQDGLRVERVHHLLEAGQVAAALDLLIELLGTAMAGTGILVMTNMSAPCVASILERALTAAEALHRRPRERYELRRGLFAIAIVSDEDNYFRTAPALLAQLRHDSGLDLYESITDATDPNERLMRALTQTSERYNATPPDERVCAPDEAIKGLAYYVAISIAIGVRTMDCGLIASLPCLLEPFVMLSPLLHAMWQNAIATRETSCDNRPEQGHRRWLEVSAALEKVSVTEMNYLDALRGAVMFGIASIEARLGVASVEERALVLDADPMQRESAMSLRRVARLHKGDFVRAEHFRKQAELLALQGSLRQMFTTTLPTELIAHALASDLTGIREAAEAIEPLAVRFPGWAGYRHLAAGYFERARGRLDAARRAFERGLAVSEPDAQDLRRCTGTWPRLESAYIETLVSLGLAQQAKERGVRALARCAELEVGMSSYMIRRALALAEARLGDYAAASDRLEGVSRELAAFGIRGLELGATYEARARIAIWAQDTEAIAHYGRLTANEYRYGQNSPLGARYERLLDEARTSGVTDLPDLVDVQTALTTANRRDPRVWADVVRERLDRASSAAERAAWALELLCEARAADIGHLYLQTGRGLELVASRGEGEADDKLRDFVTRYVTEQLGDEDHATVVETESAFQPSCSSGKRGGADQPALLTSQVGGTRVCVGAVVLEAGAGRVNTWKSQALLDALGDYLLRSGDALAAE
jgi:hypothetical protein